MYYVSEHHPDCRVFVKRLVIPKVGVSANLDSPNETHISSKVLRKAFADYKPAMFFPKLIDYYKTGFGNGDANDVSLLQKTLAADIEKSKTLTGVDKYYNDVKIESEKRSLSAVRATYEPLLLEITVGVYSVQTTILRAGIGSASVVIKLPLEENGFYENILYAFEDNDMWNLDEQFKQQSSQLKQASPRELNIFKVIGDKVDRRECALLPGDMIQIWFSKRYADTLAKKNTVKSEIGIPKFPGDYVSGFTGFVKASGVNYTGGQSPSYTITIDCEDAGRCLRLSRVNVDPSLDPRFRWEELNVSAYTNKLASPDVPFTSPSEYIRGLVEGKAGYWGGVSAIEVQDGMEFNDTTGQYFYKSTGDKAEKNDARDIFTHMGVSLVHMPWEFDKIKLNLYDDLITKCWRPYVITFKNAFRLWESDYKYRWDICKEISDVMEFEFYADNFGAINYHPPFYNWNPANVKYFIEDKEILSENHKFDETNVVTSVEIVSQPQIIQMENIAKFLSAFAKAPDDIIQRYGLKFRTKNIPALSGTDVGVQEGPASEITHKARNLYARAWINRRNAELKSATVEIPGTPELYLCNTVAFVGDLNDITKQLALSTIGQIASRVTGIYNIEVGTTKTPSDSSIINNIPVYYISGISHKYTQGGSFTTTLTLTHGRRWSGLATGSVGYSFSLDDHDELAALMRKYFGQDNNAVELMRKAIGYGPITRNAPSVIDSFSLIDRKSILLDKYVNPLGNIYGTNTGKGYLV